jgi:hypothetical protein
MQKNYKNLMQYGPPTDRQRYDENAYTPQELDNMVLDEESPKGSFPTPDGYSIKESMKYGPPSPFEKYPSALEK